MSVLIHILAFIGAASVLAALVIVACAFVAIAIHDNEKDLGHE